MAVNTETEQLKTGAGKTPADGRNLNGEKPKSGSIFKQKRIWIPFFIIVAQASSSGSGIRDNWDLSLPTMHSSTVINSRWPLKCSAG